MPFPHSFLLIRAGADVHARAEHGYNAMTHAVDSDATDCIKILNEAGADPDPGSDEDYEMERGKRVYWNDPMEKSTKWQRF